jgi:hypothetical protein
MFNGVPERHVASSKPIQCIPACSSSVNASLPLWSVRNSDSYRAVGVRKGENEIVRFFIGTHADYDKLLANL